VSQKEQKETLHTATDLSCEGRTSRSCHPNVNTSTVHHNTYS